MFEGFGLVFFFANLISKLAPVLQWRSLKSNPQKSTNLNNKKPSGLSSSYRGFDNLLYLSEFFWGLSLHPIDWIVSFTNLIALIFPSLILIEIYRERRCRSVKKWFFIYFVFIAINASIMFSGWENFKNFSAALGWLTLIICCFTLIGLYNKIKTIIDNKSPGLQSLAEIRIKLCKDVIGIIYAFSAGIFAMLPFAIALFLRGSFRVVNFYVHLHYSQLRESEQLIALLLLKADLQRFNFFLYIYYFETIQKERLSTFNLKNNIRSSRLFSRQKPKFKTRDRSEEIAA